MWCSKFKIRKLYIFITILFLLFISFYTSYIRETGSDKSVYDRYEVTSGNIHDNFSVVGYVAPLSVTNVSSQVSGEIKSINVILGGSVKKNQLLVEVDPEIANDEYLASNNDLSVKRQEVEIANTELLLRKYKLDKSTNMFASGSINESEWLQAESDYKHSKARVEIAKIQLDNAQVKLNTSKAKLSYTDVFSQIDGTITKLLVSEGQTIVSTQTATPLLEIADLSKLLIHAKVNQEYLAKLKKGMQATCISSINDGIKYSAIINRIDLIPDDSEESSSNDPLYTVYFDLGSKYSNKLMLGMKLTCDIEIQKIDNVLIVPIAFIESNSKDNAYSVTLLKQDRFVSKYIEVGLSNLEFVEVKEGLNEGDFIYNSSDFYDE